MGGRAAVGAGRSSCLMLDVDALKQINDNFGHLEGDRILRDIGAAVRGELRAYDTAARYGGDEFLVLLPATNDHAAIHVGTRIQAAAARITPPNSTRTPIPITITFGAASAHPGEPHTSLLDRADRALLNAKHRIRQPRILQHDN